MGEERKEHHAITAMTSNGIYGNHVNLY